MRGLGLFLIRNVGLFISFMSAHSHLKEILPMKSRNFIFSVLLFAVLMTSTLFSQVDYATATLRGTVMDQAGAVVAGATITATNASTGISKVVKTSSDGAYRLSALPPGPYQVTTVAGGFSKEVFRGLELTVGQSATYDVHL